MQLYRFSPIESKEQLLDAVHYVIEGAVKLCERSTGDSPPKIEHVTIFAHYRDEYDHLCKLIKELGTAEDANNGVRVKLKAPLDKAYGSIPYAPSVKYLRIRKPDSHRMQVGCADFEVERTEKGGYRDFKEFNYRYDNDPKLIERKEYEMLEFSQPDIDVLAYAVSPKNYAD